MPKEFPFLLFYFIKRKVNALLLDGFLFICSNKPVHNFAAPPIGLLLTIPSFWAQKQKYFSLFKENKKILEIFTASHKMESIPFYSFIGC